MAGLGCGNGVLATAAGVLVAQASPSARRGEALSVYFLATALSFAAGPPLGLALYARGGIQACFVAAVGLGAADRAAHPVSQGTGASGPRRRRDFAGSAGARCRPRRRSCA